MYTGTAPQDVNVLAVVEVRGPRSRPSGRPSFRHDLRGKQKSGMKTRSLRTGTRNFQDGRDVNVLRRPDQYTTLYQYNFNPIFSGKKPKKFKIKKPPRSSRSSKVSRPPELAKSSAGDDPNMDASDLNDEEIEVSAFLHDFCTCTFANLNFATRV